MPSTDHGSRSRSETWLGWTLATLVAIALSGLCVAAALIPDDTGHARARRVALPVELSTCTADANCLLVDRIGCCSCQTGGAQWAINATQTDTLRLFLKHTCKNQPACLQIDVCRGDLVAACRDGRCAVEIAPATTIDEAAHG